MVGEPDYHMVDMGGGDFDGAIALVKQAMLPASDIALTQALAVLEVSTVRGKESHDKAALGDAVYLRALGQYPADVTLAAITDLTMTARFAPALSEIVERCEKLAQPRRDLLASLIWSKGREVEKAKPLKQVSGKSWDEAPDYGSHVPALPVRSKQDMAQALRNLEGQ